jgi:hypothetical protein
MILVSTLGKATIKMRRAHAQRRVVLTLPTKWF